MLEKDHLYKVENPRHTHTLFLQKTNEGRISGLKNEEEILWYVSNSDLEIFFLETFNLQN